MSNAQNPQYPSLDDKEIGAVLSLELAFHAIIAVISDPYRRPTKHQIGESVKMGAVMAHDLEFYLEGLSERYQRADENERAARLLSE